VEVWKKQDEKAEKISKKRGRKENSAQKPFFRAHLSRGYLMVFI